MYYLLYLWIQNDLQDNYEGLGKYGIQMHQLLISKKEGILYHNSAKICSMYIYVELQNTIIKWFKFYLRTISAYR